MKTRFCAAIAIAAVIFACTQELEVAPVAGSGVYASIEQPVSADGTKSFTCAGDNAEAEINIATGEWTSLEKSKTITLALGEEGLSFKAGDVLRAFVTVCPDDLADKTVTVNAIKTDGAEILLKEFIGKTLKRNTLYNVQSSGTTAVQVGDKVYSSLQTAAGTSAVLDLNGHTFKVSNDSDNNGRAIRVTGGTLTVRNGIIDARNVDADGNSQDKTDASGPSSDMYGAVRAQNGILFQKVCLK